MNKIDKIKKKIKKYSVISFDIFDTLIKRDVLNDDQIFALIARQIIEKNVLDVENFIEFRKKAYSNAKEKKSNANIYEIYTELLKLYNISPDFELVSQLVNAELEVEKNICKANDKIIDLLRYSKKLNKKVIIISDMYLSKLHLEVLLLKCGLESGRDYDELFVSCEIGKSKASRSLFSHIKEDQKIQNKEMLHIGDALRSDFINPRFFKIDSVHIKRSDLNTIYKNSKYKQDINYQLIDKFQSNRVSENDRYIQFGYECVGPLLYGFVKWINNYIKKSSRKYKLYFLSREGQFIKKCYDTIYPDNNSEYLYVSRKSLLYILLWQYDSIEEKIKKISNKHNYTTKYIYEYLGIKEKYNPEESENKTYLSVDEILSDNSIMTVLDGYNDLINSESKKQFDVFISMMNINSTDNDILIVDIGWNGSMQSYLKKILLVADLSINIEGLYIGLSKFGYRKFTFEEYRRYGYLFDYSNDICSTKINENDAFAFCGLFESLFTADHGSVRGYQQDNKKLYPIFYEYEYSKNETYNTIKSIQNSAIQFCIDFNNSIVKELVEFTPEISFAKLQRFGDHPNVDEIKMFNDFDFFDIEATKMCGDGNWHIWNIKKIYVDFINSGWKVGFIKKHFPFIPALKIYSMIRR